MPIPATIRVRLLGSFEVSSDGRAVPLPGARVRVVLAVLALSAGKVVPTATLIERVWGEDQPEDPRASLHNVVRRLRQRFGDEVIQTGAVGYRLMIDPDDVDVLAFNRWAAKAGAEQREAVEQALALWGEPFEAEYLGWLRDYEAPRLIETYLTVLELRIDLDLADGKHPALAAELAELTGRYPLRESLWSRRLQALAGAGRQAEALELYGVIRTRIADELGVDPGAELQQVYRDLLNRDTPTPAPKGVPQQLPPDLRYYTGREDTLAELESLATSASTDTRTITVVLHGEGGVGKTSVALRWAHRTAAEFPDGRFFLRLRGYGPSEPVDPSAALEYLLSSLGYVGAAIPAGEDARVALFRTTLAGRRVLLVLDDVRSAEQVRPLLPATGAVVLVTSRNQLQGLAVRDSAYQIRIAEFSPADAIAMLTGLLLNGSAELPSDEVLAELAALCGHLPLALAIVGQRLARTSAQTKHVVQQLRDEAARLDVLETGDDPDTELRAVFSWSYRTLDPASARMFRLLGLHPGTTIGVPAAAALAGTTTSRARRLLDDLVSLHLLRQPDGIRFQLHDLLRAYAVEQSELVDSESDREEARSRLFRWYLFTAAAGHRAMSGAIPIPDPGPSDDDIQPLDFESAREVMRWFDVEYSSLAAVVRRAAELGMSRLSCLAALAGHGYLMARYSPSASATMLEGALRQAELSGDPRLLGIARNSLGIGLARGGSLDEARGYLEDSLVLMQQSGYRRGEKAVLNNLGNIYRIQGKDVAIGHYEQALALVPDDPAEQLAPLINLCGVYLALGRPTEALEPIQTAVDLSRELGMATNLGTALDGLGEALSKLGRHQEAIEALEEAVRINTDTEDLAGLALAHISLGKAHQSAGAPTAAAACYRDALTLFDQQQWTDGVDRVTRADVQTLLDAVN